MFCTSPDLCVFVFTVLSVGGDPQTIHSCDFCVNNLVLKAQLSFPRLHLSFFKPMVASAELSTFLTDAGVENGLREYILDVLGITTISIFSRVGADEEQVKSRVVIPYLATLSSPTLL